MRLSLMLRMEGLTKPRSPGGQERSWGTSYKPECQGGLSDTLEREADSCEGGEVGVLRASCPPEACALGPLATSPLQTCALC
ncbi:unnamed protein product [Rangifer tarandus platyrhynchus]|uniref:Uncharacterized protein n=1 Tax=Rangifer tarandus platyrhynchus TaxID=3082113 RepID=A0AC59Z2Y2_RANTA